MCDVWHVRTCASEVVILVLKSSQLNGSLLGKMWLTRMSTSPEPNMEAMLPASSGLFRPAGMSAPSDCTTSVRPQLSGARGSNSFNRLGKCPI